MDLAAAFFAAIALMAAAGRFVRRRARRAAALEAIGCPQDPAQAGGERSPSHPALGRWLTRLGGALQVEPGDEVLALIEESSCGWAPHFLQGLRFVSGISLAALLLPLTTLALPLSPLLFAAGYQVPVLALKRKRARRSELIARDLPEVADLMAVLCYSGMSLHMSFRHAVSTCGDPRTREEMGVVLERIRSGESTVSALRAAAGHPCREMRRFCRTLVRAEESGAPVAETLEGLSAELRSARREKDRARAARVSVLILLPLVFMILPSFLLLTVGGMVLSYTL